MTFTFLDYYTTFEKIRALDMHVDGQLRKEFDERKSRLCEFPHDAMERHLVDHGLISLNASCASCSNCWLGTPKLEVMIKGMYAV